MLLSISLYISYIGLNRGRFIFSIKILVTTLICALISNLINHDLDFTLLAISMASLSIPLLVYSANFSHARALSLVKMIRYLPIISVLIGFSMLAIGLKPWAIEFSGAWRLRGAVIAPHLAMLAFVAIYVGLLRNAICPKSKELILVGFNYLILFLTFTRGPLIVSTAVIAFYFFMNTQYSSTRKIITFVVAGTLFSLLFLFGQSNYALRSIDSTVDDTVNFSGRTVAWNFFWNNALERPLFGRGLGSVTKLTQDEATSNLSLFVVPHNEYLRFIVDLGFIGASVFFVLIALELFGIYKTQAIHVKKIVLPMLFGIAIYAFSDNLFSTLQFSVPITIFLIHLLHTSPRTK